MSDLDSALYKWIVGANERREALEFPPGLIEDSIALLVDVLGEQYLDQLLVKSTDPIRFVDPNANPLKMWLASSMVDSHIVQSLELAAYFRLFLHDPALPDKVEKLKRDSFWPIMFELAMAARMKRAAQGFPPAVVLNRELRDSVGDFTVQHAGTNTPCECSRLGHSPQVTEPHILAHSLTLRITDATERLRLPLCFKIRSTAPLTGQTYNLTLSLIRGCLADVKRSRLPTSRDKDGTSVCCGELTPHSERIPFRMVDGAVKNVDGTDWDVAESIYRVPAKNTAEVTERYKRGERFREFEDLRIFIHYAPSTDAPDYYVRLTNKLKKKVNQTKVGPDQAGKLLLIEVPFELRFADPTKLEKAVADAVRQSKTTLGIVLANREANPQYRHHYSLHVTFDPLGLLLNRELIPLLQKFQEVDARIDPITGLPFRIGWQEATARAAAARNAAEGGTEPLDNG